MYIKLAVYLPEHKAPIPCWNFMCLTWFISFIYFTLLLNCDFDIDWMFVFRINVNLYFTIIFGYENKLF